MFKECLLYRPEFLTFHQPLQCDDLSAFGFHSEA